MFHAIAPEPEPKLWWAGAHERKECTFRKVFFEWFFFSNLCFISMYSVLKRLLKDWKNIILKEYIYFYSSKETLLYTLLLFIFKVVQKLQRIRKQGCFHMWVDAEISHVINVNVSSSPIWHSLSYI